MALSSTSFVNGQIGNPTGRPLGSRNKRTKEIIQQIIESNNKDPLVTLSEISSSDPDSAIRATAANMLAPYMHSKMQSTPAPRFVEELDIPTQFTRRRIIPCEDRGTSRRRPTRHSNRPRTQQPRKSLAGLVCSCSVDPALYCLMASSSRRAY